MSERGVCVYMLYCRVFCHIAESSWLDEPFETCDVANKIDASLWVYMEAIKQQYELQEQQNINA